MRLLTLIASAIPLNFGDLIDLAESIIEPAGLLCRQDTHNLEDSFI